MTYALVSSLKDGAAAMPLVEFNVWTLRRVSGRWRIARRSVRRLGDHDLLDLFKPIVGQVIGEAIGA